MQKGTGFSVDVVEQDKDGNPTQINGIVNFSPESPSAIQSWITIFSIEYHQGEWHVFNDVPRSYLDDLHQRRSSMRCKRAVWNESEKVSQDKICYDKAVKIVNNLDYKFQSDDAKESFVNAVNKLLFVSNTFSIEDILQNLIDALVQD